MGTAEAMPIAFLGFSSIAALTWYFSSRPRLFLHLFVPRDEWIGVARWAFREDFRRGMRLMAGLQFGVACVFGLVGLWLRL
jgi:nitrate reductase gamma subunit